MHIVNNIVLIKYILIQSLLGQVFGGLCALVGVFTITLPIPIIVTSFAGFYKNRLWRNEVAQKKRERLHEEKEKIRKEIEEKILAGEISPGEVKYELCK